MSRPGRATVAPTTATNSTPAQLTSAYRTSVVGATNGSGSGLVIEPGSGGVTVMDGENMEATLTWLGPRRARLTTRAGKGNASAHDVVLFARPDRAGVAAGVTRLEVVVDGWRFEVDLEPESRARLRERATRIQGEVRRGGPAELRAIIPGRVVSVDVVEGDEVEAGQRVLVVEAMKMQNELRAPRAGRIGRVAAVPGTNVELGDLLLVVE